MKESQKMHDRQIENLLKQTAEQRYAYFIRYCAAFDEVWGLTVGQDNWVIFRDADGDDIFPVWPHSDLAEASIFEEHKSMGAKPQSMSLESFIQKCIPDMISDGIYFGIFYDDTRKGLAVQGEILKAALEKEVKAVWE